MATPYANAVPITSLSFAGLSTLQRGLIDGDKWGGGYGQGVELTYSFPWAEGFAPYFSASDYGASSNEWLGLPGQSRSYALNAVERTAVQQVLAGVERAANITFTEVPDNMGTVGELRFAETVDSNYAHAYLPHGESVSSGDMWFAYRSWNPWTTKYPNGPPIKPGSYEYMTIIHEVGHALGLKHSFERGDSNTRLPAQYDHYQWTLMAYNAREGNPEVWAEFHPTTFMYLDLVALEKMYGKPTTANLGNTEYVYRENKTYWETISDSGGQDTIVYDSDWRGGLIDLSNKDFSRLGRPVFFSDGARTFDTIRFGPSTVIENATGGEGDDRLVGNHVRNVLIANGGDDRLLGGSGNDLLQGGRGNDLLDGGIGNDVLMGGPGNDRLFGGAGNDTLYIEQGGDRLSDTSGIDTVRSSLASYTLGDGLENLELIGAARNGTGNGLGNDIQGNASANILMGGGGDDDLFGAAGDDFLDGGGASDTLDGGIGDDTLRGGTGSDRLLGGEGDDFLAWDPNDALVDGGIGIDTLLVSGDLDLSTVADGVILGIERVDLSAAGTNLLTLAEQDILDIFGGSLTILGNDADNVDIAEAFTEGATDPDGFTTYTVGTATLLIASDVNVV